MRASAVAGAVHRSRRSRPGTAELGTCLFTALHELALAAGDAAIAVAAEPADRHPVADREVLDAVADLGDGACDLVSQRQRPLST